MTKQVARIGAAVMTTFLALMVLWQFRTIVASLLISLTLAATLRPLVQRLIGRSIPIRVAWTLLYIIVLSGGIFLLLLALSSAISEIQLLAQSLSRQDVWRLPVWLQNSSFQRTLVARLPPPSVLLASFTGDEGELILPALLGLTAGIGNLISSGLIILFLSIYWSINQIHFERLWLSLLPSGQRKGARGIWRMIEPDIGSYIRGEVMESLLAGILLGLGYWLIGSPYPTLLALIGALTCLIPVVGSTLVIIPVLLVGLLTSVNLGLLTSVYAIIILIAINLWVKPRLFQRNWNSPILTVLLLIALADIFGLIGIILAPPLSVICQILWSHLVSHPAIAGATAGVADLKERQARAWDTISAMEEAPPPLIASSMERLAQLIEKAEPLLQATLPAEPVMLFHPSQPVTAEDGSPISAKP